MHMVISETGFMVKGRKIRLEALNGFRGTRLQIRVSDNWLQPLFYLNHLIMDWETK